MLSQEEIDQILAERAKMSANDLEKEKQLTFDLSKVQDHNEAVECEHEFETYIGLRIVETKCKFCPEKK